MATPTLTPEAFNDLQDCLMKVLAGALGRSPAVLKVGLEKAIQKGFVEVNEVDGETRLSVVEWKAAS